MNRSKTYINLILMGFFILCAAECSKLKKDSPMQPQITDAELHQAGWLDTLSTDFHGKYIRGHSWDLLECAKCHGDNYAGGTSGSSCTSAGCHPGTPEACGTCHGGVNNATGAPPKDIDDHKLTRYKGVGAHTAHVANQAYDCVECHIKPGKLGDAGHVDSDLPAELVWGEFSKKDHLSPAWIDSSCANVYCHGASLNGGIDTQPLWTQQGGISCDACHGSPPGSGAHKKHGTADCNVCHVGYKKGTTVNSSIHIDGTKNVQLDVSVGGSYANGVCANVSCHGGGNSPAWTDDIVLSCTGCHGGIDNDSGAPPVDLEGNSEISAMGVGAHTAHVTSSVFTGVLDCRECHVKPNEISDPGHVDSDLIAEITWGDLSRFDGLSPSLNGATCANVYCHGASLDGGTNTEPKWTQQGGISCDGCHGSPPGSGAHEEHSTAGCNVCHVGFQKGSTVNKEIHLNGTKNVQLDDSVGGSYANGVCSDVACHGSGNSPAWTEDIVLSCTGCHGGIDNETGAPPVDLSGNIEISAMGVGAHTAHVTSSGFAGALDCGECHIKPNEISASGHVDSDLSAEITWGDLARIDGLSPSLNGAICTNVYCHGASLDGGILKNPSWTQADDLACNSCHALSPSSGAHTKHVDGYALECNVCHDGYAKGSSVNLSLHVNGSKDVRMSTAIGGTYKNGVCSNVLCHGSGTSPEWTAHVTLACTDCHGGLDNESGAPPLDLRGKSSTGVKGVGAHSIHLSGGNLADGVECTECHTVPETVDAAGHIDTDLNSAEITWGSIAKTDGAIPLWDGVETCQNVYCHGEFARGNKENSPSWTIVDGSQTACGTCHGLPPADPHPAVEQCAVCHQGVVDAYKNIIDKSKHINGKTDLFR